MFVTAIMPTRRRPPDTSTLEEAQMELRLDGRVALVTGGGRGIGKAMCEVLAAAGATVAVATRTASSGEETVAAIQAAGHRAELFVVDISDREQVRSLVADVADRLGGLDIVVHNAAHQPYAPLGELTDEDLDAVIDTNLKAPFWLVADALPHLQKSAAPRFLVTSSIAGTHVGAHGFTAYGASKAGLNGFVRQAAGELARFGIRVNSVTPGNTLTDRAKEHMAATGDDLAANIPLKALGDPSDSAKALLFLASDAGSHITGQTIIVDGGQGLGFH